MTTHRVMVEQGRKGGRIGGRKKGPTKARDPEKMRAAALKRWAKVRGF